MGLIRFKPPTEDLAYLITLVDGQAIRVPLSKETTINIDSSRSIKVDTIISTNGLVEYQISLNDAVNGYYKEVLRTKLYPLSFKLSKLNDLLAITAVDTSTRVEEIFPSSVFVLSLGTNSLIPVSNDGKSFFLHGVNNSRYAKF